MNDIENNNNCKVDYIADYNVTRPVTIEEELNLAIREYIWRFLKIADPNSESFAINKLFTNNYSKDYTNIVIEAVKSTLNFIILMLLKDKTVFNVDDKKLIDRFVIERFEIKDDHLMDKCCAVCYFVIKYYKEYDKNIISSPIRIETSVALNDVKNDSGDVLINKGRILHSVDTNILYNPDVKMNYELTDLVSKCVESFNESLFEFKRRMVKSLNNSEKFNCKKCLNSGSLGMCALVHDNNDDSDIDIEKEFNNKFKGNQNQFLIDDKTVELINSTKFETDQFIFDFIRKELNY